VIQVDALHGSIAFRIDPAESKGKGVKWREEAGRKKVGTPSPLGFSQVLILEIVEVVCFVTLLQVLILEDLGGH
jgi:hypothetical protein